ncbi:MAG TPA: S41 family peptidase [Caldilineaceae bacterium]|nr:S41 family peptidase [Caldilineaceae bacterium]
MTAGYYRYPTIHQNTIVFVSEDDLWTVPTAGGVARRLTSNLGAVTFPHLSPDGKWLAFVGREEGYGEVYVMAAEGGAARRLTYLSSSCRIVGWSPDGRDIIFCSNYGQVIGSEFGLFRIAHDSTTAAVVPIDCGPARSISYGPEGRAVLGRNTQDSSRWKRYRGGTTGHLWIDRTGDGNYERFLDQIAGNIASAMWITLPVANAGAAPEQTGESANTPETSVLRTRIFFVNDHEGIGNLYSCDLAGEDIRRHTDHGDYYVRSATTDGEKIVYHVGADLYVYDIAQDRETKVAVTYHSPRVQRRRRFVDAARFLDSARLHPKGKAMAITTRGKAFAFYNHEGPVLQVGEREGVRYRLPEWTKDGNQLILVSDVSGEEVIEIYPEDPQDAPRRLEGLDVGRIVMLKLSPVANLLALANHRNELLIVDLENGAVTFVDRSPHRLIAGFDWSPDGHWLAYGYAATAKTTAIRLYQVPDPKQSGIPPREGTTHTITEPILRDVGPAFDPDGKYLYFLSYREFNPVYDNLHFELGFPWGMRPYLITLQADLPNPFIPLPGIDDEAEEEDADGAGSDEHEDDHEEGDDVDDALAGDGGNGDENDGPADEEAFRTAGTVARTLLNTVQQASHQFATHAVNRTEGGGNGGHDPSGATAGASSSPDDVAAEAQGAHDADEKRDSMEKSEEAKGLQIDLEGIAQRILPFPVPDGRYGQIAGISGKAIFTMLPVEGALDDDLAPENEADEAGTLRCYTFADFKTETLADNVNWFQLSRDRKKLLYAWRRRLRVLAAGEKPQTDSGPSRRTGWIDLFRVKVSVEPQREWEQMFREAWRLQRDHFWSEDMSEVDWHQVYERYYPLIQRVSTRSEFSDLMWEMQGELGTSHAYEYGGDYRIPPHFSQGFLGTTFTWDQDAGGYRIGPLIEGDPWDRNSTSPLTAPGVDIKAGDVLWAINGQRLDETTPPAQLLINQAGQDVLLTLLPRPTDQSGSGQNGAAGAASTAATETTDVVPFLPKSIRERAAPDEQETAPAKKIRLRSVMVRTIDSEEKAYYRAWVNRNRRQVHEATGGRVGYVHIPDMGASGYAEFHRSYLAEVDRDALIVDVRYNGGGHVSQLILEKLARRRLGYDFSRWGGLDPYPADSVAGPIVALTNEHAGSDGDIFCHSFKMMKLGLVIGKRTWGGVVGISPRHALVDGTVTTQPEFSFWFADVGWSIENYGAEPDIDVDIRPQDYRAGADPQLARAIAEVMAQLVAQPTVMPDLATRPSRALPKLPPRVKYDVG